MVTWEVTPNEMHGSVCESLLTDDSNLDTINTGSNSSRTPDDTGIAITSSHGITGRVIEANDLLGAFQRVRDTKDGEIVFVHGAAGSGKTTLVQSLRATVVKSGGFFVQGKFDQAGAQDPYSAIVSAFDDICNLVVQGKNVDVVKKLLIDSLGEELKVFARLISGVSAITGVKTDHGALSTGEFSVGQAFIRFKQQCRCFLKSISTEQHRILLFFDDLHFADEESLQLVQCIMESGIKHLLIVATYRDDEQKGFHSHLVREVTKSSMVKRVEDITLGNLSGEDVNSLISENLELDPSITLELSTICHKKTMGNPFHVVQYLKLLESENLLEYSHDQQRWQWDESKVQSETNITRNILEVITEQAQHTQKEVCDVLQLAACLGFTFRLKVLLSVVEAETKYKPELYLKFSNSNNTTQSLHSILAIAQKEGFIEKRDDHTYKWPHDRVMQCFDSMIPSDEKNQLHLRIGECLLNSDLELTDSIRFFIVDQFNLGVSCVKGKDQKLRMAKMNLEAGEMSVSRSAFRSGREYFETGIKVLPQNAWKEHYELTHNLYASGASAAHSTGDITKTKILVDAILQHCISFEDRFVANLILVSMLGSQARFHESISAGRAVLKELDIIIPQRPTMFHIIYELSRTQKMVRHLTDEMILSLPRMDEKKTMAMKLLSLIARDSYFDSPELLSLVSLRMMRLSLQHGLCAYSPQSFSMYGMMQSTMKKYDVAFRFGMLSVRLLAELDAKEVEARVMMYVYTSIHHFKRPMLEARGHFLRGYQSGLNTGDISFALISGLNVGHLMLTCGAPLDETADLLRVYHDQMIEFNEISSLTMLRPIFQSVLNLMGEAEDSARLTGEVMEEEDTFQRLSDENNMMSLFVTRVQCHQIACFFEAWYLADHYMRLILASSKELKTIEAHYAKPAFKLFQGITHLAQYRVSGQRKDLFKFRKVLKISRDLERRGVLSYRPITSLLQAEETALTAEKTAVQAAYADAISVLRESNCTHWEALCNEHAGNTMVRRFSDMHSASIFFSKSKENYSKWKAWGKVHKLEIKCDRLFSMSTNRLLSAGSSR